MLTHNVINSKGQLKGLCNAFHSVKCDSLQSLASLQACTNLKNLIQPLLDAYNQQFGTNFQVEIGVGIQEPTQDPCFVASFDAAAGDIVEVNVEDDITGTPTAGTDVECNWGDGTIKNVGDIWSEFLEVNQYTTAGTYEFKCCGTTKYIKVSFESPTKRPWSISSLGNLGLELFRINQIENLTSVTSTLPNTVKSLDRALIGKFGSSSWTGTDIGSWDTSNIESLLLTFFTEAQFTGRYWRVERWKRYEHVGYVSTSKFFQC